MTPFVGRTHELAILEREFDRPAPSLVVVYGRRRVEKATLLLRAPEGRRLFPGGFTPELRAAAEADPRLFLLEPALLLGG